MTKYMPEVKQVLVLAVDAKRVGGRLGLSKLSAFGSRLHGVSFHANLSQEGRKYAIEMIPTLLPIIDGHIKHVRSEQKREQLEIYRSLTVPEVEKLYNRLTVDPIQKLDVSKVMDSFQRVGFFWSQKKADAYSTLEESAMTFLESKEPDYSHIAKLVELSTMLLSIAPDNSVNRELRPTIEEALDRLEVTSLLTEVLDR